MNNIIILRLSLIDGIGSSTIKKMIASYETHGLSLENMYQHNAQDIHRLTGLPLLQSAKIVTGLKETKQSAYTIGLIEKHGFSWATFIDNSYPESLKHTHNPPAVLYWQGPSMSTLPFEKSLAVVGSRKMDIYGKKIVYQLLPEIIEAGIAIISGGAVGIDSLAHEIALEYRGITAVVLGSGLLKPYPEHNKKLFEKVIENGGYIISGFPLETPPVAINFPIRNRVIAGLSRTCLVMQAAEKSGALITAECALQEGRNVAAVPGSIFDPLSVGCNNLLKQGAYVVQHAHDLLELFNIHTDTKINNPTATQPEKPFEKEKIRDLPLNDISMSAMEKNIISHMKNDTEYSCDQLISLSNASLLEVQTALFELEVKGIISHTLRGYKFKK